MQWYNEPPQWNAQGGTIQITTAPKTDYWRKTHYGFIRDNGHFYYQEVSGDFVAQVKFSGQYRDLYDQAGLMLRLDETTWIKCGIEYVHGVQQASAVVTREFSDWSVTPLPQNPAAVWLRVTAKLPAVEVHYSVDGETYHLLRMGYLTEAQPIQVGIMCCSPDGDGFSVTFEDLSITAI
jgi:regulation of enolase protein 1 (concanavalin A-like superfamily)